MFVFPENNGEPIVLWILGRNALVSIIAEITFGDHNYWIF